MNRIFERLVVFAVASIVFSPTLATAQTEISARGATVTIGGRLHVQARTSTVDGAVALDSYVRRARIFVGIEVNDFFEARILPDFAGGRATQPPSRFLNAKKFIEQNADSIQTELKNKFAERAHMFLQYTAA